MAIISIIRQIRKVEIIDYLSARGDNFAPCAFVCKHTPPNKAQRDFPGECSLGVKAMGVHVSFENGLHP